MKNQVLNLTPENEIPIWKNIILKELLEGNEVYYIMDTETTGLYARGAKIDGYIRDRIIEIGVIVAVKKKENNELVLLKDDKEDEIYFHEYINFLRESETELLTYNSRTYIPKDVIDITGISKAVLEGLECMPGTEKKLSGQTPTFLEMFPFLENFLLLKEVKRFPNKIKMVAHNADFDYSFLNEEMQKINEYPIESFIEKVDTRTLAQDIIKKDDFEWKNNLTKIKINKLKKILSTKKKIKDREKGYLKRSEQILETKLEEKLLTEKRRGTKSNKVSDIEKKLKKIKINNENYSAEYIAELLETKEELNLIKNYSLDHLSILLNVKIERKLHGALLDSKILFMVYERMIKLEAYKNSNNNPNKFYPKLEKFKINA